MNKHEDYLGDGVYVSLEERSIVLDLREQDDSKIVLEPEVFKALLRYKKRMDSIIAAALKGQPASQQ